MRRAGGEGRWKLERSLVADVDSHGLPGATPSKILIIAESIKRRAAATRAHARDNSTTRGNLAPVVRLRETSQQPRATDTYPPISFSAFCILSDLAYYSGRPRWRIALRCSG